MLSQREQWFWLNHIAGVGNVKLRKILNEYDYQIERIYRASREELKALMIFSEAEIERILSTDHRENCKKLYEQTLQSGIDFVVPTDASYPGRLQELYDKPYILYYRGQLPKEDRMTVSVVGARNCSEYGRAIAYELGYQLAAHQVDVISGLAIGIDSYSHQGALNAGGITHGILAGGVGKCYPMQNFNIYMDMIEHGGGVLSEFPDDVPTRPGMFPIRNRIISGLSDALIVVEAQHHSGSLITATLALEQNKEIFAVPGRIGDVASTGCNELINEGARLIVSVEGLLEDLGLVDRILDAKQKKESAKMSSNRENISLAPTEKMLYSLLLDFTPKSLDTLLDASGLPLSQLMRSLVALEIYGLIREISKNFYVRVY